MDLVQWIVPANDGALRVGWAPAWADRLGALGSEERPVRRRGAPLVSRWLPHPLAVGAVDDVATELRRAPAGLALLFGIALDGPDARPPLPVGGDDVRFAGIYAELVKVVADLCEAAGLPPASLAPLPEQKGLEVVVGAVGPLTLDGLADAVVLVRCAIELCAHARGLQLVDARVRVGERQARIDGRTRAFFEEVLP